MTNYYEILKVEPTANTAEIETAWETAYNQWRRLVTHHDPKIVNQANEALQVLEQMRITLLDPNRRAAYDAGIGLSGVSGGLADPEALLRTAAPHPLTPPPPKSGVSRQPELAQLVDAWVCPKCQTANAVGTRFCKKCGQQIGRDCPSCEQLMESIAPFCSECGANVEEATHLRELEEARQAALQQQEAERQAMLEPIQKRSNEAMSWAKTGCICFFIPVINLISIPAAIGAVIKARQALSLPQVPGDAEYRARAKKALWMLVPIILVALYIMFVIVQVVVAWRIANKSLTFLYVAIT